jgi:hypothetical protein
MDMKDDNETHSLDTWTPLGKAASDLLTSLRTRMKTKSNGCDISQRYAQGPQQPKGERDKILDQPSTGPLSARNHSSN